MKRSIFSLTACLIFLPATAQYVAAILPTPNGGGTAAAAGSGQIVGGSFGPGGGPTLWDGPSHTLINLSPAGYDFAEVFGVGGGKQVGYGFTNNDTRAIMWAGSAASVVDLHPAGFLGSVAYGTDGSNQVGAAAAVINESHASLWSGSSGTFVDLHPGLGYDWSEAYDVDGGVQVGVAENVPVLWRNTAASMEALPKPKGATIGSVGGIHGSEVAGFLNGVGAIVWNVDNSTFSVLGVGVALDTNGTNQVGRSGSQAVRWSGTAGTELNLHQFLPGNITESVATGIGENGTIVGWGHINGFGQVPIVWTPVPEPQMILVLSLGIAILTLRRKR